MKISDNFQMNILYFKRGEVFLPKTGGGEGLNQNLEIYTEIFKDLDGNI